MAAPRTTTASVQTGSAEPSRDAVQSLQSDERLAREVWRDNSMTVGIDQGARFPEIFPAREFCPRL